VASTADLSLHFRAGAIGGDWVAVRGHQRSGEGAVGDAEVARLGQEVAYKPLGEGAFALALRGLLEALKQRGMVWWLDV
jgi:hypothetical protein